MEAWLIFYRNGEQKERRLPISTSGRPYLPELNHVLKIDKVDYRVDQVEWNFDNDKILVYAS